ncbi:LuxR C-terminal-related transcriptional regulator [Streptomyces sp. NPDC047028]|uniref:helix-turn-helix transcriptional regulator n=1 Tax=Streptomyces sp. NPDC047028 TaxID=3155793 RepID=UPI0033EE30E7
MHDITRRRDQSSTPLGEQGENNASEQYVPDYPLLVEPTVLIGRRREMHAVQHALTFPSDQYGIILAGPSGVGKTRLGAEIARVVSGGKTNHASFKPCPVMTLASFASQVLLKTSSEASLILEIKKAASRTRSRPLIIWADDAHLLPVQTIDLLLHLATSNSVQLIFAINSDENPSPLLTQGWKDGHLQRMELAPLLYDECQELVTQFFSCSLSPETVERLARLADGNPATLRELARTLVDRRLLTFNGSQWECLQKIPATSALRELIYTGDCDSFSPQGREVAEIISLIGSTALHNIEKMAEGETLSDLEKQNLLEIYSLSEYGQPYVRIRYPLMRHWLRESVSAVQSKRYLEKWSCVIGQTAAKSDKMALVKWRLKCGITLTPESLYEAINDFLGNRDVLTAKQLVAALWNMGGTAKIAKAYIEILALLGDFEAARSLADTAEDKFTEDRSEFLLLKFQLGLLRGNHTEYNRVRTEAAVPQQMLASSLRSYCLGRFSSADHLASRLLNRSVRTESMPALIVCIAAKCHMGQPLDALNAYDRFKAKRELALESPDSIQLGFIYSDFLDIAHAAALRSMGQLDESCNALKAMRERAVERRQYPIDVISSLHLGRTMYEKGRLEEALGQFHYVRSHSTGWAYCDNRARIFCALIQEFLPLNVAPVRGVDDLEDIPREYHDTYLHIARAWRAHRRGEYTKAKSILLSGVHASSQQGAYADVVNVAYEMSRMGWAKEINSLCKGPVQGAFLTAKLNYIYGLANEDNESVNSAATTFMEMGAMLYAAEAFAELSRMYRRISLGRDAAHAAAQAERLLKLCGAVASPSLNFFSDRDSVLTQRERELAYMAARGLSDKEISQMLHLSSRTVSNTLYRVYRKLLVSGRRELRDRLIPFADQ